MISWTSSGSSTASTTDDKVSIRVGQSSSLDALRLASGISTVVLTLLVRLEIVRVALTSRIDKFFAVSSLRVEPPAIRISSAVSLFAWQFADVLWSGTTDSSTQ